jgi:hemoglobin-like flavoprotein
MGKYRIYGIASDRICLSPYQTHMKPQPDIHDLYAEAIAAETPEELDRVIPKLRQALHEHCEDVRGKLAHYPLIARRLVRQINDLLLDQETMPRGNQAHGLNSKKK